MLTATRQSRRNGNGIALNDIGHQGLMHDEEFQVEGGSLIHNRARTLHPGMRRFVQRDPWMADADGLLPTAGDGYQDGMGRYQYVRSNPMIALDPDGMIFGISCVRATAKMKKACAAATAAGVVSVAWKTRMMNCANRKISNGTCQPKCAGMVLATKQCCRGEYDMWLHFTGRGAKAAAKCQAATAKALAKCATGK